MNNNIRKFSPLLLLLGANPAVAAGSVSNQFNIGATVLPACSVSATDLTFGSYAPSNASVTTASNAMSINCTNALPYTIALDGGLTAGNVAARTMTDGASHYLAYFLYANVSRSTTWGDGTAGTATFGGTGTGTVQPINIYGAIPAAQFLNTGSYTDKVTITINY